jgi:hypothetical protein
VDGDGLELLRVVAAAAATGCPVTLAETGAGCGVLSQDDLDDEALRLLDALAAVGVRPEPLGDPLPDADAVLVKADPARRAVPALVTLRKTDAAALAEAGQVVS